MQKERIAWADILRFLGMTLIYWGHLGTGDAVTLYIFAHHVPLFFLISGFFAGLAPKEGGFFPFLWKKVRGIVFPYIIFTLLFYLLQLATGQLSLSRLPHALLVSAAGVRNQVPGPLWFLPCLFVICIAFELIKRLTALLFGGGKKGRAAAFVLAVLLYLIGILFLGHEPAQDPRWIWNVDSAFVYILYYALGAAFFPAIRDWKYQEKENREQILFSVCFFLSLVFAVFVLWKGTEVTATVRTALTEWGSFFGDAVFELYGLAFALILIFMEICFARFLALIPGIGRFLAFAGKDSLYLCGNEMIIKYFLGLLIPLMGLSTLMKNDLFLLLYSLVCIVICVFTLNLLERLLFGRLFGTGQIAFSKK